MVRAEVAANESRDSAGGNVPAGAATSSVAGAAAGGAGGVIFANVGQWAAAGAVGGAVGSLTQALLQGLFQPNLRSHRISNSLTATFAKKGYEPVGWK